MTNATDATGADPLPGMVAALIRAGVAVVVEPAGPRLVWDPANLRATGLARRCSADLGERRDEAVALFARLRLEVVPDPPGPEGTACRVCRATVFPGVGGVTPADVWAACRNHGQRRRVRERDGFVTHKYHPPCPWMQPHPEVPVPDAGLPAEDE